MLRHIAMFRFRPGTTPAQVEAATEAFGTLSDKIDVLRKFRFGPSAGITDGAWDYAVVAVLDDADAYVAYRDHPAHVAVVRDFVAPIVAEAARTQFESDGDSDVVGGS